MLESFDLATGHLGRIRREIIKASRAYEPIERLQAMRKPSGSRGGRGDSVLTSDFL